MPLTIPSPRNSTTEASLIKKIYMGRNPKQEWMLNHPLLAMLPKMDDFDGSDLNNPLRVTAPVASHSFAVAQDNAYPSTSKSFSITRIKDYGVSRIDEETKLSMRNDSGGFVTLLDASVGDALKSLEKRAAYKLYRNSGGACGVVSAIGNGAATNDKITLTSKSDVIFMTIGMKLGFSSADGTSGSLRGSPSYVTVASLDFSGGIIYVEENTTSAVSGATAGDYLFAKGDFGASVSGLLSWVPAAAVSTSDSFFGVNRSAAHLQLSGSRITDTSMSIEEAIYEGAALCSAGGGRPDACFMNPLKLKELCMELDTKVVRDPGGTGVFGFSGVAMDTPGGRVAVYGDWACPLTSAHLVTTSSWGFHSLGGFPHLVDSGGTTADRVFNADQIEIRVRYYGNLICKAPGQNATIVLAA